MNWISQRKNVISVCACWFSDFNVTGWLKSRILIRRVIENEIDLILPETWRLFLLSRKWSNNQNFVLTQHDNLRICKCHSRINRRTRRVQNYVLSLTRLPSLDLIEKCWNSTKRMWKENENKDGWGSIIGRDYKRRFNKRIHLARSNDVKRNYVDNGERMGAKIRSILGWEYFRVEFEWYR